MRHVQRVALLAVLGCAFAVSPGSAQEAAQEAPEATYQGRNAAAWAVELRSEDVAARRRGVYGLWQIGSAAKPHVRELAGALRDDDEYVRTTADRVLARWDWQVAINTLTSALPELVAALADERAPVRAGAANLIWRCGPIPNVRGGEPPPKELVPALAKALSDADAKLRANAAASLANLGATARDALPALRESVRDEDAKVRLWSARAIGWIVPTEAVPILIELLDDPDPAARTAAVEGLGGATPEQRDAAIEGLEKALADDAVPVRIAAANSLWVLQDPATLGLLAKALTDDEATGVRSAAASAIGALGRADSLGSLTTALAEDPSPVVRAAAAAAMGGFGPELESALPALVRALEHDEATVRGGVGLALGRTPELAGPAVPALIAALDREGTGDELPIYSALMQIATNVGPDDRIVAALLRGLDASGQPRQYAIHGVAACGASAKEAVPRLAELLPTMTDMFDRRAVYSAFQRFGPDAVAARGALRTALDTDAESRTMAAGALACVTDADEDVRRALTVLRAALDDQRYVYFAIPVLARVGPRAKPLAPRLRELLEADGAASTGAAAALLRIEGDGAQDALAHLLAAIGDGDRATIGYLGQAGRVAAPAVPLLIAVADDAADTRRSSALAALVRIGAEGAAVRRVYTKARADADAYIRTLGLRGLRSLPATHER